jgi:hypothetical protein
MIKKFEQSCEELKKISENKMKTNEYDCSNKNPYYYVLIAFQHFI